MILDPIGLEKALEAFLSGKDFKAGVISSTRGKRQKTNYVVELMPEGRYRILMEAQVGNKSDDPDHLFLDLPSLNDKDLTLWRGNEESYFNSDFAAKEESFANQLRNDFKKDLERASKIPANKTK